MANCPKCGSHLRLIDWRQHCPHCGANIVIYDLQERLMQQADSAEVQYYHFQKKVNRVKASFVGNKFAIMRIFASILPVGPLFLTLIKGNFSSPLTEGFLKINFLGIYDNIESLGSIFGMLGSKVRPDFCFALGFAVFAMSIVLTVLHFALNTLACSPKGKQRNITIDVLILLTTICSAALFAFFASGGAFSGSIGLGAYLYVLAQIVNTVIDFITLHKGIEVKEAECFCGGIPIEEYFKMVDDGMSREEIRQEQYKRLQAAQDEKEEKLAEEERKLKEAEAEEE
ncbi:MAG: zinc ribbon domain-containing protein [Clostridia bacterium]|nr:zinc ribbon domain-containing protein [Clostridia bacterium]